MAFEHTSDTHKDDECEDDLKAVLAVPAQAECNEEYEIKDSEDNREPSVLVHHGDAQEIKDPLFFVHRKSDEGDKRAVEQDVDIVGNNDRLYDPLFYEALKIIRLLIEALQKSVAGSKEEDGYEISTCINERKKDAFHLEDLFLRNVVEDYADGCKTS